MEKKMENISGSPVIRIAVTGPESTGKSVLSASLADHFHTVWVPEYAREYMEIHGPQYTVADIEKIARGQRDAELQLIHKANRFLFCDTDPLVTMIWSEHAFGRCPAWISGQLKTHPHDFYLLCDIDLPWEADPLREHPHLRGYFFELYRKELISLDLPYSIVRGTGRQRLENAILLLEERFPFIHSRD